MHCLARQVSIVMICGLVITGCTVHPRQPVGTGTFSYVSGRLAWTYPVNLNTVWSATLRALEQLEIRIQEKTIDGLGGLIYAQRADETRVSIQLEPISTRASRVSIKVGPLGNREQSEKIHNKIQAELKL